MKDLENIYICAVRYALNRSTYITGLTVDYLKKQTLSIHCKNVMIKDIEDCDHYGMGCDKERWDNLLTHLKK